MDPRRAPRSVIDPKVRRVGFFTGTGQMLPSSAPFADLSSSPSVGKSLSPVMIPPPRHPSDTLSSSPVRRSSMAAAAVDSLAVGSYNASELLPGTSPSGRARNPELSDDLGASPGRSKRSPAFASSSVPASGLTTVSVVNLHPEKAVSASVEVQLDRTTTSKSLKERTSKAERRALQEAQRAAKAKGSKAPTTASGVVTSANVKSAKPSKIVSQKNDSGPVATPEKKGIDRPSEKDRKKDVPHPRMQYDDTSRVEKAKKRAVVKQTEARNRVELFRHLPQYELGTQLPDLEAKFFQLEPMHPAVCKVGLQYLSGDICGGNARCVAMLQAFQEVIKDYSTPSEKTLSRDLTAKVSCYVSFFIQCRPLSISMGNAIRFLKNSIAKLPLTLSESESKASLHLDIERFINEKIILADKVIVKHAVTKINDGDVLLTYGLSSAVEMLLLHAHELGKQFRVVVVDSRPKLEGKLLLRRLVGRGLSCTYTHINAVSYIMHEVTRVFLGAASVLTNGTVFSRVGTASIAMVADAFRVPVLVCCEAYKFHERVQLDSICSNELGDPDAISKVYGSRDINVLDHWANSENLQLLNLMYDAMPSDYVSMIITDYGMVPSTSVPVIVREYRGEHIWM
ncbi:translation initiation factor eIF-2B subunit delta [Tripterygium wilfordii]|uniref:Translation initiation factor eIF2B subunit delta n=1 Tax=Tripterygium wilfordii TaxID=458696 RepID=A0A7J7DMC8_TRIWF|nr:translation initiation factor eIF-2B subunit delta-like [Tripterygium wilfordii]KAF5747443.1 translation initiation factor eIF-2B subunit delta [Tripterygium wilfordii]